MLKSPMKFLFDQVVLNDVAAPPGPGRACRCDAYRPYDWALPPGSAE